MLSVSNLMRRFLEAWEALVRATYTPSQLELMGDMLQAVREGTTLLGSQVNLLDGLAGSWFSPPSIVAAGQISRLNFVSEMILAPAGLALKLPHVASAPWQPPAIEVSSLWAVMLTTGALWLVAQIAAVFWLRWVAFAVENPQPPTDDGWKAFPRLAGELTLFCLVLGIIVSVLRLPLGAAMALMLLSGNAFVGAMFALIGGITLWITLWLLLSLYFTGEGLMFEHQPLWRSMLQGAAMLRGNVSATLGLVALVNLLLVGFGAVWGMIGQTPAGAAVALAGNAYLSTAMLLSVFTFYRGLHKRWLAIQSLRQVKEKQPSPERVDDGGSNRD